MAMNFVASANDKQPYGSYRIDVYSLKVGRRMTLYGKAALCQFIDLEADPKVTDICERPLVIPNSKPQKVVDFWAKCGGSGNFYLLQGPSIEMKRDALASAFDQFEKWAQAHEAQIVHIDPGSFESRRIRYDNWSTVLQHLITHRGPPNDQLLKRCHEAIKDGAALVNIETTISDIDAMLVRAAVFTSLIRGDLRCDSIDTTPINPNTKVTRV